jgi:hypothetical protein
MARRCRVAWLPGGGCHRFAVTTACASEHDADNESMTPRIIESPDAGGLREFLLRESDVHAAGWPDAVAGDLDEDVAVFETPDPRGPCGGAVPQAPLEGSVARSFSTPDTVVIELVVATDAQVESYLAMLQAGTSPATPQGVWVHERPTRPSICSRSRSACPLWRAYSSTMWTSTARSDTGPSQGSSPTTSRSGASAPTGRRRRSPPATPPRPRLPPPGRPPPRRRRHRAGRGCRKSWTRPRPPSPAGTSPSRRRPCAAPAPAGTSSTAGRLGGRGPRGSAPCTSGRGRPAASRACP